MANPEHNASDMIHQPEASREYFYSPRGFNIFYKEWHPEQDPKAIVIISHGYGEHIDRIGYDKFANMLVDRGYVVFGCDHQGHGRSSGTRGYVQNYDDFLLDFRDFTNHVTTSFPDLPTILFGHSNGGLIASKFLIQYPDFFDAAVLSAPCLAIDAPLRPIADLLVRAFSKIAPKAKVVPQLESRFISRNEDAVEAYLNDPLVITGNIRARFAAELTSSISFVMSNAENIRIPILLYHSASDRIVPISGTDSLHATLLDVNEDVEYIRVEDPYHEIFEDEDADDILGRMVNWLEDRF
eukprot:TRINITY_DN2615_c0_g1_i3.p1 TRINITY_DN2615_c0_g1~~TRINITY_DN2615_c0_g1_i3.p1  ORF type:complete len:297 (-),score=43.19 TRINITY_DN2615_c0_g1_i3:58-948(-)